MSGGFDMFSRVVDLPFIARRSRRRPSDVRRYLNLPDDQPLVLLSFGGYGVSRFDLRALRQLTGYTVVVTGDVTENQRGHESPSLRRLVLPPNFEHVDERALTAAGYRYEDLVADVVVTKPGYGIVAECVANHTAILYTSRGHFVEYDVIVREMPRWLRCEYISQEDLLGGQWQAPLDRLLQSPGPPELIGTDGAERAADAILEVVNGD